MDETESVSAKHYEEFMKDEEHHEPHNLVLRTMIERLKTFPDRVNRLAFGLGGGRTDVWPCNCERRYWVSNNTNFFVFVGLKNPSSVTQVEK